MIRAKGIPKALEHAIGDGVVAALLMQEDGSLLGSAGDWKLRCNGNKLSEGGVDRTAVEAAGDGETAAPESCGGVRSWSASLVGAFTANIWTELRNSGAAVGAGGLRVLLLELEGGVLGLACCSGYLVCVLAEKRVKMGIMKISLERLDAYLGPRLEQLYA
eukprot:467636_1